MIQTRGAIHPLLQCQDGMGGGGGEKGGKSPCHYRYNTALGTKKLPGRNKIPPPLQPSESGVYWVHVVRPSVRSEDQLSLEDQLLCWKTGCFIGR